MRYASPVGTRSHPATLPDPQARQPGAQVPLFDWRPLPGAARRIDLGGKALTNFMKELVSYRCHRPGCRGAGELLRKVNAGARPRNGLALVNQADVSQTEVCEPEELHTHRAGAST